jgi:hypothetical protein
MARSARITIRFCTCKIVSVGTGTYRYTLQRSEMPRLRTLGIAAHALSSQISDAQQLVLMLMSWLGYSPTEWIINSEIGGLGSMDSPGGKPLFKFLRYDVILENEWLSRTLGVNLDNRLLQRYRLLDAPENIPAIYDLGARAAELQIKREDLIW